MPIAVNLRPFFALTMMSAICLFLFNMPEMMAQEQNQPVGKAEYIQMGCYQCHGYEGQGGGGPRLAPEPLAYEAFANITRRPYGVMPAYPPALLSEETLGRIYQYMNAIPQPQLPDSIPLLSID